MFAHKSSLQCFHYKEVFYYLTSKQYILRDPSIISFFELNVILGQHKPKLTTFLTT